MESFGTEEWTDLRSKRTRHMTKIGFQGVENREFEPLPRGRFLAKLSSAEFIPQSKRSGEPGIAWETTVTGGEYDNRKGFLNTSLQPQALWSTQRILMALGMTKDEIDALQWDTDDPESIQSTLNELIGEECVIVIRHEKYEGEDRQRVSRILDTSNLQGVSNAEAGAPTF